VAKIKAERERREKIDAECKRLQIPRLLAIKGVRRLRPVVVQCDATSLSRRDHFLLETETHVFHYKGEFAPFTSQRTRAVERAQEALQKERMVPLKLVSVKPDDAKEKLFWDTLHGNKFSIGEGVGDNVWELKYNQAFKLYRYDAEIGLMPEEDVSCNKLDKKSIFVVAAPGELYVWYGKETGLLRRNHARSQAIAVYKNKPEGERENPNAWVQIREIHQGSEDYVFRQKFPDWIEMSAAGVPLDPHVLLEIFSRKMLDFNPAKVTQIEDVDGSLDIWVAKDHGKVPISKVSYGEFFNGNSYIVLYQSLQGRVVYFWQGSQSHVSWDHAADSIKVS
jgi:gelsolin